MRSNIISLIVMVIATFTCISAASADLFGTGANQFTIDFVPIAGDAGDLGSWPAGSGYTFTGVNRNAYRMGTFEITNDQWTKFTNSLGVPVTGDPASAYDSAPYWSGTNVPTNCSSWYEAAQFVNWLNTSTGHQAAYRFTGTQGTGDYALDIWSTAEAAGGTNLYRHKDAMYYLPTEDEWVKTGLLERFESPDLRDQAGRYSAPGRRRGRYGLELLRRRIRHRPRRPVGCRQR